MSANDRMLSHTLCPSAIVSHRGRGSMGGYDTLSCDLQRRFPLNASLISGETIAQHV